MQVSVKHAASACVVWCCLGYLSITAAVAFVRDSGKQTSSKPESLLSPVCDYLNEAYILGAVIEEVSLLIHWLSRRARDVCLEIRQLFEDVRTVIQLRNDWVWTYEGFPKTPRAYFLFSSSS